MLPLPLQVLVLLVLEPVQAAAAVTVLVECIGVPLALVILISTTLHTCTFLKTQMSNR